MVELSPINDWLEWHQSSDLLIAMWPEWYSKVDEQWNKEINFVGFLCSENEDVIDQYIDDEIEALLEDKEKPPILITGGSSRMIYDKFYINAIAACEKLNYPAIAVTRYSELLPEAFSDNIKCRFHLPIDKIMGRCKAVIHHGGLEQ